MKTGMETISVGKMLYNLNPIIVVNVLIVIKAKLRPLKKLKRSLY